MICDFCGSPAVEWLYPTRPFTQEVAPGKVFKSNPDWIACETCHGLIEQTQRAALTQRSAVATRTMHTDSVAKLRELHDRFWENRDGPSRPLTEQELHENAI